MKSAGNTKGSSSGAPADPEFNDSLPAEGAVSIDPDAAEFRDELQVGSYASIGALQTELERERQEAERATLDTLEAMRGMDAGDQVKWRISRTGHENDELNGYLETWPNHLMTIERLRDRFGGGTYWCKGFRRGHYTAHKTLQISGEAKRKPSGVEGVSQSAPVNSTPSFDVQSFLTAQERRDERRREDERRERSEREERDEKRRQERLQLMLTLGPSAIAALGNLFSGRQDNTAALVTALKPPDPLTMLTQLKALQGSGQDGVLGRVLPMLINMAGSKTGGSDTGWLDVIKEFVKGAGPAVGQIIESQVSAARMTQGVNGNIPPILPSLPSGIGASSQNPQNPSTQNMIVVPESVPRKERRARSADAQAPVESAVSSNAARTESVNIAGASSPRGQVDMSVYALMPHLPWLREMLRRMLDAALNQREPELYAALFVSELPDGIDPNVVGQLLASQEWFGVVCQIEPRWGANTRNEFVWLDEARQHILRMLSEAVAAEGGAAPYFAQHAPPAASADGRASAKVDVRGPATHMPAASSERAARATGVVDRPTKLPSLTGD